ncbi:MAG: glycoside hydrolase family 13 protein [Eubacterium sp.]
MKFIHNSWDLTYREPFGALPMGSKVSLKVKASNATNIKLRTYYRSHERFFDMFPTDEPNIYQCNITLPNQPDILWYDFCFTYEEKIYRYGTKNDNLGGEGHIYETYPSSFQITLYDPKRKTPSWYKEGIMYQIFPDRFNKGEKETFDPIYPKKSLIHGRWDESPHYFRGKQGNIEYWDFFGGNLQGIIEKLDYLKSLNITILYLNPIFESHSNHKYDTADYYHISPEFGTTALFEELCQKAKKRGIRVILDGVFSHTGDDSIYFNKYNHYPNTGAYQSKDSPYYNWYRFNDYPDEYESWWGVKSMPNIEEHTPSYQDFIFRSENSVIRHWLKAGASGWRLDVADELPDDFIVGLKEALVKEKSDAVLIGEVWEDASRKIAYSVMRQYFSGYELDAVMNYPFRDAFIAFIIGAKTSSETARLMMSLYENYPRDQFMGNMNLIGSHDRTRILTILSDAPSFNKDSKKERYRLSPQQYELAKKKLKLLSLIQMTFPGVPCIYYGDEAGNQGYEDPYNRGTYPWGHEDQELLNWYKKITQLRTDHKAFQKGAWYPLPSEDNIFVFMRYYKEDYNLCLFNRSINTVHPFNHDSLKNCIGKNLFTDAIENLDSIILEPLSFKIFKIIKCK